MIAVGTFGRFLACGAGEAQKVASWKKFFLGHFVSSRGTLVASKRQGVIFLKELKSKGIAEKIPVYCAFDEIVKIDDVKPNPKNPNQHPEEQIELLAKIIQTQGWRAPVTVSTLSGLVVRGHGRLMAAIHAGFTYVPVDFQDYTSESEELADLIADNRISELSEISQQELAKLFSEIELGDIPCDITGYRQEDIENILKSIEIDENYQYDEVKPLSLAERFVVPPTSILNARSGEWLARKEAWLQIGISSEIGRKKNLTFTTASISDSNFYNKKKEKEIELGRKLSTKEFTEKYYELGDSKDNGTSIFDPVLCELCYKWFSFEGAKIIDPFAGGSVRGIVAALTGRHYTGIDLRKEQIEANVEQWNNIRLSYKNAKNPIWINGDSSETIPTLTDKYDLVFSCPPYADLEVYSDDPADLSNMQYDDFLKAYRNIIKQAADCLKDDRFAIFVVGEVRDKKGNYRDFVGDTVQAFRDAGLNYYNEGILVTPLSGARFRIGKMFTSGRKLCKTHQNILVFVKGNSKKAASNCGDIEIELPESDEQI